MVFPKDSSLERAELGVRRTANESTSQTESHQSSACIVPMQGGEERTRGWVHRSWRHGGRGLLVRALSTSTSLRPYVQKSYLVLDGLALARSRSSSSLAIALLGVSCRPLARRGRVRRPRCSLRSEPRQPTTRKAGLRQGSRLLLRLRVALGTSLFACLGRTISRPDCSCCSYSTSSRPTIAASKTSSVRAFLPLHRCSSQADQTVFWVS